MTETIERYETPRVCLSCEHPCYYYGRTEYAEACREEQERRDARETAVDSRQAVLFAS